MYDGLHAASIIAQTHMKAVLELVLMQHDINYVLPDVEMPSQAIV